MWKDVEDEDVGILVVANLLPSDWIGQVGQVRDLEVLVAFVNEPSTLCTLNLKQVLMHLNCLEVEFEGL